jgi:tripartite-type tricarboxylate transporter receptor subunit TctC
MLNRRLFIASAASVPIATAISLGNTPGTAQPVRKTVHFIVGLPAGGAPDAVARLLAENMKGYAPSIIIDNRPGAGGRIALDALKSSDTDGSVIALTPVDHLALFPHVYTRLAYRVDDFLPVTTVCVTSFLLTVGARVPASVKAFGDFIVWCRNNPREASYGTAGAGTHPHFLGVTLGQAAGFSFTHIPYKGGASAIQDVIAGHLTACISTIGTLLPSVQAGGLRAIATTGPKRSDAIPDVPTFKELGYPALESVEHFGVLVPARTPTSIVTALHDAIHDALKTDAARSGLAKLTLEPVEKSPAQFAELIASNSERWARVVKSTGFKPLE